MERWKKMGQSKKFQILSYMASRRQASPSTSMSIKGQNTYVPYDASITCFGADGYSMRIFFIPTDYNIPNNQTDFPKKTGWMFLPKEDYPFFIDLLRNEKPIYGHIYETVPQANRIATSAELVGEEEG